MHRPGDERHLRLPEEHASVPLRIEVWVEGTSSAGRELVHKQRVPHVAALNFASAKSPGGGFLNGAKAQEEDLARCSALYACLKDADDYYHPNRISGSALYTDHIIYSPGRTVLSHRGYCQGRRGGLCAWPAIRCSNWLSSPHAVTSRSAAWQLISALNWCTTMCLPSRQSHT